jgi:putative PEP-CTERM system TPR-repeat lipoprotein
MADRSPRLVLLLACSLLCAACSGPTPDVLLADARAAIAAGELRTAGIHLKNLLQREPDNVTARAMLGEVSLGTGDFAAAEENLRRALTLGADPAALQLPLARALVAQRRFEEAAAQLATGPQLEGSARIEALSLEGAALLSLGKREQAEASYRAALRLEPGSPTLRSELAALLLESGRPDAGRALIDAVLADEPEFVPALLLRGDLQSATGQPVAAEATLQRVVDLERVKPSASAAYFLALAKLIEVQLGLDKVDAAAASADALLGLAPQDPRARHAKAAVEVRQNDLDGAERRLERLIADAPEYWPAYRLLGAINVNQNQPGQAMMYLRTAVNNAPADAAARVQLAELYIREGNIDEARALIEASQTADVGKGVFLAFAGRASQRAGLDEQAAQFFEQSEAALPKDVRQLIGLSDIYVAAGEFERAVRVLQSAPLDGAQGELLRNYLLALVQVRQGDLDAADSSAQRVVAAAPAAGWPLNLRGTIALLDGRLDAARELLDKALELEPRDAAALLNAARVAVARNDRATAQGFLERVVAIDAGNVTAYVGLAELAAARRDFPAAHSWVDRLPASPLRLRLEAELLAAQGRFEDAAVRFGRAFDSQPSAALAARAYETARRAGSPSPDAKLLAWNADNPQDPSGNFMLGSVAIENGRHDAAIERYESVLAVNPQHAPTLNNLAWLYSQRGDERALDYAERAYAAEPNNPAIADTLGWLYVERGDAAKGLPLLTAAAAGLADNPEVQYHLGVALAETGDNANALAAFEIALSKSASFAGRDDAQRRAAALRERRAL